MFKIKLIYLFLALPIIHVLAQVTTNYFDESIISTGDIRVILSIIILSLLLFKYGIYKNYINILIILFCTYNALLVIFDGGNIAAIINLIRMSLPLITFMVAYKYINSKEQLLKMTKIMCVCLAIYSLSYVFANIFDLGVSTYLEDSFYLGGAGYGATNEIAIMSVLAFSLFFSKLPKHWNLFNIITIGISLAIVLLVVRRGAYLTLGISLLVLLYFYGINKKIIISVSSISIFLLLSFPLYGDIFLERLNTRTVNQDGQLIELEEEGRYMELKSVPATLSKEGKWIIGMYNLRSEDYFGGRPIHVGYLSILHGSGLIGLALFLLLLLKFMMEPYNYFKRMEKSNINSNYMAIYYAVFAGLLVYLISSRLHGFTVTFPVFMIMGSILGYFKKSNKTFS